MTHKQNQYKKCCLNCEYWSLDHTFLWTTKGYCSHRFGAFTNSSAKCGHFKYTKALLKEMENDR